MNHKRNVLGICKRSVKAIKHLRRDAVKYYKHQNYEQSMACISACAMLQYTYNQSYMDSTLEHLVTELAQKLCLGRDKRLYNNDDVILFYDSFGLDTRGLALIYLDALISLGYKVVYITYEPGRDNQPEIDRVLSRGSFVKIYRKKHLPYVERVNLICDAIEKYKPSKMFFYCMPNDVGASVAFAAYNNIKRYQINLTDHAYWLGTASFDYCIEFRDYGANVSRQYRHIRSDKIVKLPYYPYKVDCEFQGFPFDTDGKKIIFSGGSLYKTINDDMTYYKLVDKILIENPDTIFLYAGGGDDRGLKELSEMHPDRVFHIAERKDLSKILDNIRVYINTYPMLGGLMMQYAASAGRPPLTLTTKKIYKDSTGVLLDENNLNVYFFDERKLLDEVKKVVDDDEYFRQRGEVVKKAVISDIEFGEQLKQLLENGHTKFNIFYEANTDTKEFLKSYIYRMNPAIVDNTIATVDNKCIKRRYKSSFMRRKKRELCR